MWFFKLLLFWMLSVIDCLNRGFIVRVMVEMMLRMLRESFVVLRLLFFVVRVIILVYFLFVGVGMMRCILVIYLWMVFFLLVRELLWVFVFNKFVSDNLF